MIFFTLCFYDVLTHRGITYWSNDSLSLMIYCNNVRKHYQIKWEGVDDEDLNMALTYFFPDLKPHLVTMDNVKMSGILLDTL
ncbi:hypothetical protein C1H46_017391 [Malus baccata]|uniref:Uncharacterized protein n=1 Tax=Malus baccata TaxID=106549 RepID=A0A540MEI7_MALBA|nr:hypothetical protein C1H46_017391 [Malus baccata]